MFSHASSFHTPPGASPAPSPSLWRGCALPGVLAVIAVVLLVAMVLAPLRLAGVSDAEWRRRSAGVGDAFAAYWKAGEASFPPPLSELVDHWARFHAIKAVIAAVLLLVCIALTTILWRRFLQSSGIRTTTQVALVLAAGATTVVVVVALVVLVANVQGAAAPLSSVLTLLPGGGDTEWKTVRNQVVQQLTAYSSSGRTVEPLVVMVDDFARFHVVLAVEAGIVTCACLGVGVITWRTLTTYGASGRRTRAVRRGSVALVGLLGVGAAVVCVGNITVAIHPAPALLGFFTGGW